jgi:hypothetical protein
MFLFLAKEESRGEEKRDIGFTGDAKKELCHGRCWSKRLPKTLTCLQCMYSEEIHLEAIDEKQVYSFRAGTSLFVIF